MKTCNSCSEDKPLDAFYKEKKARDGRQANCKDCARVLRNEWGAKNRDKERPAIRKWKQKNKGKVNSYTAKRHAAKMQRTPPWADLKEIQLVYRQAASLSKLLGRDIHVDHVIPMQGKLVSGLHIPENMQLLFAEDNVSKSNTYEVA